MTTTDADLVGRAGGVHRIEARPDKGHEDEHAGLDSRPSIALEELSQPGPGAAARRGLVERSRTDCR